MRIGGLTIWVPKTAEPKFRCRICDEPFWELEKLSRHMKPCSDKHEEELRENYSLRSKSEFLFDDQNGGDVEYRDYVRRTGNWH